MKLHLFGNVFVREDKVDVIRRQLESAIHFHEMMAGDVEDEKESEDLLIFSDFLKDILNASNR